MKKRDKRDIYEEHCEFVNETECEEELDDVDINIGNGEY